jgi:hypothetical protein
MVKKHILDTDMISIFNELLQSLDNKSIKQSELWDIAYSIDTAELTKFGFNLVKECKKNEVYLPEIIQDLCAYYSVKEKRYVIKETMNNKQQGRLFMEILVSWDAVPLLIKDI